MADLPAHLRDWRPGYKRGAPYFEQQIESPCGPRVIVGAAFKPDGSIDEAAWAGVVALVSAAPDLLEAAKAVVARWDTPAWQEAEPTATAIAGLRAAIAKASGESQP